MRFRFRAITLAITSSEILFSRRPWGTYSHSTHTHIYPSRYDERSIDIYLAISLSTTTPRAFVSDLHHVTRAWFQKKKNETRHTRLSLCSPPLAHSVSSSTSSKTNMRVARRSQKSQPLCRAHPPSSSPSPAPSTTLTEGTALPRQKRWSLPWSGCAPEYGDA